MAKVLFVDDEPDIELLTRQKFRKQTANGIFELRFAQNGQAALDLITKEPDIAVIVSDINMPGMDGLTLLEKLKEISPAIKTIVVSAYGDIKTFRLAMNKGVFDFITKPVDFNELEETILDALTQYGLPSPSLYVYQLLLAATFPEQIDLSYSREGKGILWDAFIVNSQHLIALSVSALSSSLPMEIAVSTVHGILRAALQENMNLSLTAFEDKLSNIHSSLKAHVLIGHYHMGTHIFSYQTNGEFKAHYISSEGQTVLMPSQTALLTLGDGVTLENLPSSSHLSLTRIHRN